MEASMVKVRIFTNNINYINISIKKGGGKTILFLRGTTTKEIMKSINEEYKF